MDLLFVVLLAGSAPQASAAAPAPAPAAAAKPAGKKSGLVCVEEAPIGSRLGSHRVCRTAEEWRRDQLEARDDTDRAQRLAKIPGQ